MVVQMTGRRGVLAPILKEKLVLILDGFICKYTDLLSTLGLILTAYHRLMRSSSNNLPTFGSMKQTITGIPGPQVYNVQLWYSLFVMSPDTNSCTLSVLMDGVGVYSQNFNTADVPGTAFWSKATSATFSIANPSITLSFDYECSGRTWDSYLFLDDVGLVVVS